MSETVDPDNPQPAENATDASDQQLEPTVNYQPLTESAGTVIGPYKLLQQLGEGGFGVVYLAEQTEPVKRKVALKIIKPGMDSEQVLARFEAERQALALMDHPNIAKVLDAGTTESGRPFFVMELVKGLPITEYCDQEHLSVDERLELFVPVCQAVQHAHQKGIIHRDLKPSNVMLALYDGKPVPKVIDFGVAKATSQKLTEKTMFTQVGSIIGTLEYMAPEQAELNNLDIDTRADIYSLGVLLYELLTGAPPFSAKELRKAGYNEMLRVIKEVSPTKPSTKISSSGDLPAIAANRKLEPDRLARTVRGELDWIVMKCLEKERHRRYETANSVALEIGRYLANEPILAGPPSATYRLRTFIRRNKGAVAAVIAIAVVLIGGIVGTSAGLISARRANQAAQKALEAEGEQRLRAEKNEAEAAKLAKLAKSEAEEARRQSEIAKAVNDFLNEDLLSAVAPSLKEGEGRAIRMFEVLDEAAKRIEQQSKPGGRFAGKPLVEARIRLTIGETYLKLGEFQSARHHLERAFVLRNGIHGADHLETAEVVLALGLLDYRVDKKNEALARFRQARRIREKFLPGVHPKIHEAIVREVWVLIGSSDSSPADYEVAYSLAEKVRAERKKTLPPNSRLLLETEFLIARLKLRRSEVGHSLREPGETILRRLYAKFEKSVGADDAYSLRVASTIAWWLNKVGKTKEALNQTLTNLKVAEKLYGHGHFRTLEVKSRLATIYEKLKKTENSVKLRREIYEGHLRIYGGQSSLTRKSLQDYGGILTKQSGADGLVEVEKLFNQHLNTTRDEFGEQHRNTVLWLFRHANFYHHYWKKKAPAAWRRLLTALRDAPLPDRPYLPLHAQNNFLIDLYTLKRYDEAIEVGEKLVTEAKRLKTGDRHTYMLNLGNAYRNAQRYKDALRIDLQNLNERIEKYGEVSYRALQIMGNTGNDYFYLGRFPEAVALYRKRAAGYTRLYDRGHVKAIASLKSLALLLQYQRKYEEELMVRRDILDRINTRTGKSYQLSRAGVNRRIIELLALLGRYDEAIAKQRKQNFTVAISKLTAKKSENSKISDKSRRNIQFLFFRREKSLLATYLTQAGNHDEAVALRGQILKQGTELYGDVYKSLIADKWQLAMAKVARGDEGAEKDLETILSKARQKWGEDASSTVAYMQQLAEIYLDKNKSAAAKPLLQQVIKARLAAADKPQAGISDLRNAAAILVATRIAELRDPVAALKYYDRLMKKLKSLKKLSNYEWYRVELLPTLARAHHLQGKHETALKHIEEAISIFREDPKRIQEYKRLRAKIIAAIGAK